MKPTEIMPHRAPMLFIDQVIKNTADEFTVGIEITKDSFGFEEDGVPSWFGLEYMAQAIAAYHGLYFSNGKGAEIGFLVGARDYSASCEKFKLGSHLEVLVRPNFIVENSGSFDCKILIDSKEVGVALLTTFKPEQAMLEKMKGEAE